MRRNPRWSLSAVALTVFTILGVRQSNATEPLPTSFKLSLGYHYSSGTYGTLSTTEIAYVPLTAKAEVGSWSIQATVPYLRISGPAALVAGPNGPIQTTGGQSDGLGDILLRGAYTFQPYAFWVPFVDVLGLIKFPSASRAAGLGTGEFDFGLESEFFWSVGRITPFAAIGYRFLGSPPGTNLDDVLLGSVGGLYRIVERVHAGVFLDYRQAPSAAIGERLEVIPFGSWQLDTHWTVDLYASAGLAKGSPDAATGLQLAYTW
jgi:hypothetical protein